MTSKPARGFAAISPERQREIASLGGRAAHERRTAHEFTSDEAREAGRKGGVAASADREHMAKIGRRGSQRRWQKKRERTAELLR
jgi:general stress protein YciG